MTITLEQILQGIRELATTENAIADLTILAEALEDAIDQCTPDSEDDESEDESDDDQDETDDEEETVVDITDVEEVDHLTTMQLMLLGHSVTTELTNRALAVEDDGETEEQEESESGDNE